MPTSALYPSTESFPADVTRVPIDSDHALLLWNSNGSGNTPTRGQVPPTPPLKHGAPNAVGVGSSVTLLLLEAGRDQDVSGGRCGDGGGGIGATPSETVTAVAFSPPLLAASLEEGLTTRQVGGGVASAAAGRRDASGDIGVVAGCPGEERSLAAAAAAAANGSTAAAAAAASGGNCLSLPELVGSVGGLGGDTPTAGQEEVCSEPDGEGLETFLPPLVLTRARGPGGPRFARQVRAVRKGVAGSSCGVSVYRSVRNCRGLDRCSLKGAVLFLRTLCARPSESTDCSHGCV